MRHGRRGLTLLILLALAILAVGFALIYLQMSRHGQLVSFRFEQAETVRGLAESAMEEAFAWLHRECSDFRSATAAWVRERPAKSLTIPLPAVRRLLPTELRGGQFVELAAEARLVDFRSNDHDGAPFFRPADGSPGEGVGTLECRITATLWQRGLLGRTRLATGHLIRHHDLWVVSMVTPRDNTRPRAAYAHNFALDHVLLVRDGLAEFRESGGRSLNTAAFTFTITQDDLPAGRRGKVFFGGTDSTKPSTAAAGQLPRENYVFLNLAPPFERLIPPPLMTEYRIPQDDVLTLVPSWDSPGDWQGIEGVFPFAHRPLFHAAPVTSEDRFWEKNRDLLALTLEGAAANLDPGLAIVSGDPGRAADPGFVGSILEGAIRQRFHVFSHFYVDLDKASLFLDGAWTAIRSRADLAAEADQLKDLAYRTPCVPLPSVPPPDMTSEQVAFLTALPEVDGRHPPLLTSKAEASFKYGTTSGDPAHPPVADQFPLPRFFDRTGLAIDEATTGPTGFRPWGHFSLWHRRQCPADPATLEGLGLLDSRRRVVRLNGIVHVAGDLSLGDPESPWTVEGQGVLVAPAITVRGSLVKARPDDLCVLFARRGPIVVETDRRIEAALVAVNDAKTGAVLARRALDLRGAIVVDRLATERWAIGVAHRLAYDPALKSPDRASYVVNLSRWVSFHRWIPDAPEGAP